MRTTRTTKGKCALRCASYLRCSSDDQRYGDYTTIDTQRAINRAAIEGAIAEAGGGEFIGEYSDEGRTGTNLKRPDWKRLLTDAQSGRLDVLYVTYMSRLARGKAFHIAEYLLQEAGVEVRLVQEHFTPDMAGQINKEVTVFTDGIFPKMVSQWTKTKQQQMVAQGYHTGGTPRFGYRAEHAAGTAQAILPGGKVKPPPKRLVPDEEERVHVLRAFEVFADTGSAGAAQRYLRAAVPGRPWAMDTVLRLLKNDVYRGIQRFGPHVNPAAHEAIVPEHLWDRVQAIFAAADEDGRAIGEEARAGGYSKEKRRDIGAYYLRGRIFCEHCGCRMTPTDHHGRAGIVGYYECIHAAKRGQECPARRVNGRTLHEAVLAEIQRLAEHPTRFTGLLRDAVRALPAPTDLRERLALAMRGRREADRKIGRCVAAIEVGGGALAELVRRIRELGAHKAELSQQIADMEAQIARCTARRPDTEALLLVWRDFSANWGYLTEEERTEMVAMLVEKVTMESKEKGTLHLALSPEMQSPLPESGLSSDLGSAKLANLHYRAYPLPPVNPPALAVPIATPHGGRNRRYGKRAVLCGKGGDE